MTLAGDVTVARSDGAGRQVLTGPPRVVLAALLLEDPTGVPRDRLAEIVWPDARPRTWASALRTHVSKVRTLVSGVVGGAGETVVSGDAGYQLVLPDGIGLTVDVHEAAAALDEARRSLASAPADALRRAGAAAALVRAPFLPGHPGEWADTVRARLRDVLVSALEVASEAARALGDDARAIADAEEAVQRAPLRESAHRAVMAAFDGAGNRAEALRAYQRLRRVLADELGVDPSPETEAAYVAMLGPVRPAPAAGTTAGGQPPAVAGLPPDGAGTVPFVGRRAELAELTTAWEQAAGGARHLVVVTGEAGIGKTRLAAEAARHVAHDGGRVLFGRCDEEAILPYQPLVEALDGLVAATPPDELPVLTGDGAGELATILPSFDGPRRPGPPDRARLYRAVTDLVASAAKERPLLLVLDDLQWADDDTLLLLRHLLRWAGVAPVLVVAIARDHDLEPGHALADVVHSLDRDGWVRRLGLQGLGEDEVREMLAHLHGAGDHATAARRLVAETAGNPFLLTELARAGGTGRLAGGDIPQGVQDLVSNRVARLLPPTVELLRAGAVAGTRFDLDLAGEAAGLHGDDLLDSVDSALRSGLVVEETPDVLRFPHDIVRRTLVAQLSGARRRALHGRTADAVERLRAHALDARVAVLAHHSSAGADPAGDERAVHWSRRASLRATERGAPAEAVRLARQALAHVPPGRDDLDAEVSAELGVALLAAGDLSGARILTGGARRAAEHDRPEALERAALALADAATDRPALQDAARDLLPAALATSRARVDPDSDAGRDAAVTHARLLVRQIRLDPTAIAPPPRPVLEALHGHLVGLPGATALDQRQRLASELAALAAAADDAGFRVLAAHEQAMAAASLGDESAMRAALDDLRSLAVAHDDPFGTAAAAEWEVVHLTLDGNFAAARRALETAVAATAAHRGAEGPDGADAVAARHRDVIGWLTGRGPTPAPHHDLSADGPDRLHALGMAAIAACDSGDIGTAGDVRAQLAPHADLVCGMGYRTFVGAASFHLGRLNATLGDWSDAERHLLAALRVHSAWHARPWVALTQAALADVLEARGRPSDREWIAGLRAEARYVMTSLGLRPL